jgi:hypothetical protein
MHHVSWTAMIRFSGNEPLPAWDLKNGNAFKACQRSFGPEVLARVSAALEVQERGLGLRSQGSISVE